LARAALLLSDASKEIMTALLSLLHSKVGEKETEDEASGRQATIGL